MPPTKTIYAASALLGALLGVAAYAAFSLDPPPSQPVTEARQVTVARPLAGSESVSTRGGAAGASQVTSSATGNAAALAAGHFPPARMAAPDPAVPASSATAPWLLFEPSPRRPQGGSDAQPVSPGARDGAAPITRGPHTHDAVSPAAHGPARLAIVIDDIGHNLRAPRDFIALGLPLTYTVLPRLAYSRVAADMIHAAGGEYLIHLPMEPMNYPATNPGPAALLLDMAEEETRERLGDFFAELPHAVGASNHMGSAYTFDARHMRVVQQAVAGRGGIFLNSVTAASPVPRRVARTHGYSYLERHVFLDNEPDAAAIGRQLARAVRIARRHGRAVAIGHPYRVTRRALAEWSARGAPSGVRLVTLSALREDLPRRSAAP